MCRRPPETLCWEQLGRVGVPLWLPREFGGGRWEAWGCRGGRPASQALPWKPSPSGPD